MNNNGLINRSRDVVPYGQTLLLAPHLDRRIGDA